MVASVDICNRALSKIGEPAITSLDDNTKAARECKLAYDPVRKALLRDHLWNFAITRVQLAPDATAPAFGFERTFTLPPDCLKVIEIDETDPFTVEGRKLLTDAGPTLNLRYVSDFVEVQSMDSLFVEVLAAAIAAEIAEPITQSNAKRDAAERHYREIMNKAVLRDAQEQTPASIEDEDWINARF